jgi:hypothetical protein
MTDTAMLDPRLAIGGNNPPIADRLATTYADELAKAEALADRANAQPKEIDSDETLKVIGDIAADAQRLWKTLDAARTNEKAPYLQAGREVDGYFAQVLDRATRIKTAMLARATAYNRAKAEKERREREEIARKQREEAEAKRREAEQAAAAGRVDDAMADVEDACQAEAAAAEATAAAATPAADLTRVRSDTGTSITTRTEWTHEIQDFDAIPLDRLRPYLKRDAVEAAIRAFVKIGNRELAGVRIFQNETAQVRR